MAGGLDSQQCRQGGKVGPKARGRVTDATVATTATPVGERRGVVGSARGHKSRRSFWLFLGGCGKGLGRRFAAQSLTRELLAAAEGDAL